MTAHAEPDLVAPSDITDPRRFVRSFETGTQTIDLNALFAADVHETASFDLRSLESTALGKLLDALPIPTLLVDQWYGVVFCNEASVKIGLTRTRMQDQSFLDLLPPAKDRTRATALADKALQLLGRTFESRKPQRAEAILEIAKRRMWARLSLRSVRIGSERYLLVLIEDLTSEKALQRMSQREEKRLRVAHDKLKQRVEELTEQLRNDDRRALRQRWQDSSKWADAHAERQKFDRLCEIVPFGTVLVKCDGSLKHMNQRFTELFGYTLEEIPTIEAWVEEMFPQQAKTLLHEADWFWSMDSCGPGELGPMSLTAKCKDGTEKIVDFRLLRLDDGDHLMTCEEVATLGE